MINFQAAEKEIKEYFKRHARIQEVVDDCAGVIRILKSLDDLNCADCHKKQIYQQGYKDGYNDCVREACQRERARRDRD